MKKKTVSLLLALALSAALAAPVSAVYETPTFTDVPKSFWGYVSIEKAAENKWISGNPDGTFAPNANVTYAQFCVMLVFPGTACQLYRPVLSLVRSFLRDCRTE